FLLAPASTDAETATTYSSASGGAKAGFLLLRQLGYHVERWEKPQSELKPDEHTVLILADPSFPNPKQKLALGKFIAGGGRVIATGTVGAMFLPENHSDINEGPKGISNEYDALTPSVMARAAPKISLVPYASWTNGAGIPLY